MATEHLRFVQLQVGTLHIKRKAYSSHILISIYGNAHIIQFHQISNVYFRKEKHLVAYICCVYMYYPKTLLK